MPHTERKYRKKVIHPKRVQVTDEDGWTHVANTHSIPSSSSSSRNSNTTRKTLATDGAADDPDEIVPLNEGSAQGRSIGKYAFLPAEAPSRLTISDLRKQFDAHLATWESSQTWQHVKGPLLNEALASQSLVDDQDSSGHQDRTIKSGIDNVVCIGLGSPSGFVQGGWVDRRSVALYQLAALFSIINCLKQHQNHSPPSEEDKSQDTFEEGKKMKIVAQDPVFNDHDIQLLSSLGITVVDTPIGFNAVTDRTFLFAPGAERRHLQVMLPSNPFMVFGGPLEEEPSLAAHTFVDDISTNNDNKKDIVNTLHRFTTQTRSIKLPEFEPKPEAFWRMRIYWRDQN